MANIKTSNVSTWVEFLQRYYKDEMRIITNTPIPKFGTSLPLIVEYTSILTYNVYLADDLLEHPDTVLAHIEDAMAVIDTSKGHTVRITGIPRKIDVRNLRECHVNKLVCIDGMIRKISDVNPCITEAAFECARCKTIQYIPQEGVGLFIKPAFCNCNDEKKGVFKLLHDQSKFIDFQRMLLQESPEDLPGGAQPQSIDVHLSNDLVGVGCAGNRVIVTGILRSVQTRNREGPSTMFETKIDAVNVEYKEDSYDDLEITPEDMVFIDSLRKESLDTIIKRVVASIAPTIYGYDEVKEALGCQLFSGIAKNLPDGSRIRGDIHVLLVGDPGIAKSQILRYVVKIAPRGVYASGKGATNAGLTAAATKDEFDGQWTLEAGALVQADKGLVAVDEMDKMKPEDRSGLHEAMEQQEISVAKAGILATLKSRCALVGAANPKLGRFDPFENIPNQINMPPSLLSRFDLIFIMRDVPEEKRDLAIGTHIASTHRAGEILERDKSMRCTSTEGEAAEAQIKPEIDANMLRKYICYAKSKGFPVMTDTAKDRAIRYYFELRKASVGEGVINVTARQLEGIIRLSEAYAKMQLSDKVTVEHVERAIKLINNCLRQISTDTDSGKIDIDILTVGVGASQRERIKGIKHIIAEIQKKNVDGIAEYEDIRTAALEQNITEEKLEKEMKKLREIGEIIHKGGTRYKLT